ncbi:uncharacterized protein [Rutidosis leptorrhynchoides]|uniref:uncharacterized protein n=1 Tax=Rutidosis leptorrhynchoides TaxID=125765 RepID=UPI003A98FAF2
MLKDTKQRGRTKNSYALAWPEALPESAILMKGFTFVSDTFYSHTNLWHRLSAMVPFVGWSMKEDGIRPTRWVLFHRVEIQDRMGSWLRQLMETNFGHIHIEAFGDGDVPYCFEKASVMRHDRGRMGKEKKRQVFDLLRCKARSFCGIEKKNVQDEDHHPVIRFIFLVRNGSRAFKNKTAVSKIFSDECGKVKGCTLKVAQIEELSFCDQVRLLTNTDILASPHGVQLTNMLFMDRNSSMMEFFPKGWKELGGVGQFVYHWMAEMSRMRHHGAWWNPHREKDGLVAHNDTYFAEWPRGVLNNVRISKLEQIAKSSIAESKCVRL